MRSSSSSTLESSLYDPEASFYSKKLYLSYSGLNKLLFSPSLYYKHYVLQQREDKLDSYLIDGKVIHCLLLDNGSFDEQFVLTPDELPSGNTRMVIDRVFKIHELRDRTGEDVLGEPILGAYEAEIIKVLTSVNLHQSLKTDAQRISKIVTDSTISYFEFLKKKGSKDLIDAETLKRCNDAVDSLRFNQEVSDLLGLLATEKDRVVIQNEQYYQCEYNDKYSFGLKGVLDNVRLDAVNRRIYINDLKTTGKTISEFRETIEYYNYWLQAAIYQMLIESNYSKLIASGWKIVFHFVVIDKYNQVYPFEVSENTMEEWKLRAEDKLKEAEWHYTNRDYTLPFEFAAGKVVL